MTTPIMDKILALLAKAERTDNEHEADAYMAKAQELMVKHAIEESQLKRPEDREKVVVEYAELSRSRPDASLIYVAGRNNGVQVIREQVRDEVRAALIGFPADIAFVRSLYASLVLQRESALRRAPRAHCESARSFGHSFRMGYSSTIDSRLRATRQAVVEQTGPGTDIVLRDRSQMVAAKAAEAFPNTRRSRVAVRSHSGYGAGQSAAQAADISGGRGHVSNLKALA